MKLRGVNDYRPVEDQVLDQNQASLGPLAIRDRVPVTAPKPRSLEPPRLNVALSRLSALVQAFDDIKRAGITHTNRIPTGEYGEWLACKLLNLRPAMSKVSTGGDGMDATGRSYEVKTRIIRELGRVPSIKGKNAGEFDYFVAVSLGPDYEFQRMWIADHRSLDWNGKTFQFGPRQAEHSQVVDRKDLIDEQRALVSSTDSAMLQYKNCLRELRGLGVIRSEKTLAADLGEFFASCYFDIELEDNINEPGHDAVDASGRRYQIKTRLPTPAGPAGTFQDCFTTYTSFDFKKQVLETKEFESLIACFLDSDLKPIAFLTAPYEAVVGQILGRAQSSGKKPSPRFRWNWNRFQKGLEPGARIYLTHEYSRHAAGARRGLPMEVLPF